VCFDFDVLEAILPVRVAETKVVSNVGYALLFFLYGANHWSAVAVKVMVATPPVDFRRGAEGCILVVSAPCCTVAPAIT
jgi:hypothetical protein